jgi:hypothetical protein
MKELIFVFIGGGLGSLVRFLLGKWVNAFHNSTFSFGTFTHSTRPKQHHAFVCFIKRYSLFNCNFWWFIYSRKILIQL